MKYQLHTRFVHSNKINTCTVDLMGFSSNLDYHQIKNAPILNLALAAEINVNAVKNIVTRPMDAKL